PVTIGPACRVREAIRTMLDSNVGALLVVDEAEHLLGIFSERDLLTKIAGLRDDYADRPASEFMTREPEAVAPYHTLAFALHKMDCGGYRHVPVLVDGQPVAMISVRDMLRHITPLCGERGAGTRFASSPPDAPGAEGERCSNHCTFLASRWSFSAPSTGASSACSSWTSLPPCAAARRPRPAASRTRSSGCSACSWPR